MSRRISTAELRTLARIWPASRLRSTIAATRQTMAWPSNHARNGMMASGPDVVLCARHVAIFRAELRRRVGA